MSVAAAVSTINVQHGNSPAEILEDIEKVIAAGASVVLCQEFGQSSDRAILKDVSGNWRTPLLDTAAKSDPVIWNADVWRKVKIVSVFVNAQTDVNSGAGGDSIPARALAATTLEHIATGVKVTFGSVHLCPTSNNGTPFNTARGRLLVKQIDNVADFIRQRQNDGELVCIGGDFNVAYEADIAHKHPDMPFTRFGKNLKCWPNWRTIGLPNGGTHGERTIDWVCMTEAANIRPTGQQIVPIHSDHDAVVVTYQLGTGVEEPPPVPEEPEVPYVPTMPPDPQPLPQDVTFEEYCR